MKTKLLLSLLFSFSFYLLSSQIPQGFNYQAIARDGSGNPMAGQSLQVEISIQSDTTASPNVIWKEQFNIVKTNAFGLFTVVIGKGVRQSGTAPLFDSIKWSATEMFIKTQIYYSGSWKYMGQSKLWSVPYAMVSGDLAGPVKKLAVTGQTISDTVLFEVKNNTGQTIFAVYNEGVRIYVDDGIAKGSTKGGFAIGGFGSAKAPSQEYLRVTRDSTRVYVNPLAKGNKGGFAIGGFSGAKAGVNNFLKLTIENYFIGHQSGAANTTGLSNTFIGYQSGFSNTEGNSNVFLGHQSGYSNKGGYENIFIGRSSGYMNIGDNLTTTGSYNIFIGSNSGYANITGKRNIFLGYMSGATNDSGESNVFIGMQSGFYNKTGNGNVFLGTYSGYSNVGGFSNIFLGPYAGYNNISGTNNLYFGSQAGQNNTTGNGNTYVGSLSGWNGTAGSDNTLIGYYAASNRLTGESNVIIGSQSGRYASAGSYNVLIGTATGQSNTGNGNIFIGYQAGIDETIGNRLYIENSSNNSSNALIYGEFDNDIIKLNATVNIRDVLKLQPRASAPPTAAEGDIYYDSTTHKLMVYNGTAWQPCN
jgi:hypothetical protein